MERGFIIVLGITLEFLEIWEELHNFNYGGFAIIKSQSGLNNYKIGVKECCSKTNDIGIMMKEVIKLMKNKVLLTIILIFYTFIPILILFNNYLFEIKFYILTFIGLIIFIIMKFFKVKNKDLGINKDNILASIKRNLLLMILFVIIIILLKILHIDKYVPNETVLFYLFYVFISCPIQEFLYRGVFGYFEINTTNNYLWVIISSLYYSFVHIIYKDIVTCIFTFIIGIVWYLLYRKDYNLCGVILSHIILGMLTISLGIVN